MPTPSKHRNSEAFTALGNATRAARKRAKLSQEALAQAVEMDRSYVGAVERGENSIALLPLIRIAGALNTTVAALMAEAGL